MSLTELPGHLLQNPDKFREGTSNGVPVPQVLWRGAYRTHRSSRYGYERRTDLTEVPGTGMNVIQNLTEVPGTGMEVLRISKDFRVL